MVKKILVGGICLTLLIGLVLTPDVSAKRKAVEIRTWMYLDDAEEIEGHGWGDISMREDLGEDAGGLNSSTTIILIPGPRFPFLMWIFQPIVCNPPVNVLDSPMSNLRKDNIYRGKGSCTSSQRYRSISR